jgi:hypothetical protein
VAATSPLGLGPLVLDFAAPSADFVRRGTFFVETGAARMALRFWLHGETPVPEVNSFRAFGIARANPGETNTTLARNSYSRGCLKKRHPSKSCVLRPIRVSQDGWVPAWDFGLISLLLNYLRILPQGNPPIGWKLACRLQCLCCAGVALVIMTIL